MASTGKENPALKEKEPKDAKAKKATTKAERRAKQERERALKNARKAEKAATSETKVKVPSARISSNIQADDPQMLKKKEKRMEKEQIPKRVGSHKKVVLFSHLHQYDRSVSVTRDFGFCISNVHPSILRLGLQYAEGVVTGSNARCAALMSAMKDLIVDYQTPPDKELYRHLEYSIKPSITFLNQCRPLSVSMANAIKYIKSQITNIDIKLTEEEAKREICHNLDAYVKVNIHLAGEAISKFSKKTIKQGDVVLVYGGSSLITQVLVDAHKAGCEFEVIVADGRPKLSGVGAMKKLRKAGIQCSYILVSAVPFMMPEVTKVMFGAHGLLSNGCVIGSVGTSLVSLAAHSQNVPVIVCCETHKFCERVQTDSIVSNEIGDPLDLVDCSNQVPNSGLVKKDTWNSLDNLKILNLTYDVTPPDLIAMVVTELGMIPCTSVPVVLRLKNYSSIVY